MGATGEPGNCMIRAVRPTDVVALASLQASASLSEVTALASPHARTATGSALVLRVLLHSLVHPASRRSAWVYSERGRPAALLLARWRLGGLAWDVERLLVGQACEVAAADLLEHVCQRAGLEGARRVFLEVAAESPGLEIARRAGFEKYTSSWMYVAPGDRGLSDLDSFEARPRRSSDNYQLFRLYNATVPARVRSAEALTFEEWRALFPAPPAYLPPPVRNRRHLVWELGSELVGWVALSRGAAGEFAEMLVNPKYADGLDKLIAHLLQLAQGRAPLYVRVREYQSSLAQALEKAEFQAVTESHVLVRHLAARVPEARLVPAKLAGS